MVRTLILTFLVVALSAIAAWLELPAIDAYVSLAAAVVSVVVIFSSWADSRHSQKELATALEEQRKNTEQRAIEAELNALDMVDRQSGSFSS